MLPNKQKKTHFNKENKNIMSIDDEKVGNRFILYNKNKNFQLKWNVNGT